MAAKGSCKDCGCECNVEPGCHDCCRCYPAAICVLLKILGDPDCVCECADVLFEFGCGTAVPTYSGTLVCDNLSIDLSFTIEEDGSGVCRLFLESSCLGLTGNNRQSRIISGSAACLALDFSFALTGAANCGDLLCDSIIITTKGADVIPNPVAVRECDGCTGCACITRRLCITYNQFTPTNCTAETSVIFDPSIPGWTVTYQPFAAQDPCDSVALCGSSVTILVTLGVDAVTNECTIQVSVTTSSGTEVAPVRPFDSLGIQCPFGTPSSWSFDGGNIIIDTLPDPCALCVTSNDCCPCPDDPPDTLTATITVDPFSFCGTCMDGQTITMTRTTLVEWIGSGVICGRNLTLKMFCGGATFPSWRLELDWSDCDLDRDCSLDFGGGCSVSCDPFEICWSISAVGTTRCCASPGIGGEAIITITE